jgi:uncharacterized damage-inducible protein DinB
MSSTRERHLEGRLNDHRAAVREFVVRAGALGPGRWLAPRAEGKWTPAQETRHLILAYDAFLADIQTGTRIRLRGTPWKRRLWRAMALPYILWRRRIPVAIKAPGEVRPEWEHGSAAELLPLLEQRAARFEASFTDRWRTDPARRMSHPYLGDLSLDQAIRFVAVHTRHHAAFLPVGGASPATLQ